MIRAHTLGRSTLFAGAAVLAMGSAAMATTPPLGVSLPDNGITLTGNAGLGLVGTGDYTGINSPAGSVSPVSSTIPEPTTLALAGFAAPMLVRPRRKASL